MFWILCMVLPFVILTLFACKKPLLAPLSIVISLISDIVFLVKNYYYETLPWFILFAVMQLAVVSVAAFVVRWKAQE